MVHRNIMKAPRSCERNLQRQVLPKGVGFATRPGRMCWALLKRSRLNMRHFCYKGPNRPEGNSPEHLWPQRSATILDGTQRAARPTNKPFYSKHCQQRARSTTALSIVNHIGRYKRARRRRLCPVRPPRHWRVRFDAHDSLSLLPRISGLRTATL
jgi:hypothetical protein